jgi:hypothetical protein
MKGVLHGFGGISLTLDNHPRWPVRLQVAARIVAGIETSLPWTSIASGFTRPFLLDTMNPRLGLVGVLA